MNDLATHPVDLSAVFEAVIFYWMTSISGAVVCVVVNYGTLLQDVMITTYQIDDVAGEKALRIS